MNNYKFFLEKFECLLCTYGQATLLKPSKQFYFRFFQENTEGLKYTQKGIKMISLNNFIRVQLKCS